MPIPPLSRIGRPATIAIGAALLALGGAAGAFAMAETRPSVTMAPVRPVPIASLSSGDIVTIRGQVAEIYGDRFVMADASGRALVDTGPQGAKATLVTPNQAVTVQGRFDRGFVHAAFLVGADGKIVSLAPLVPPHGPRGGPDDGPGGKAGTPPPPPPPPCAKQGAAVPATPPNDVAAPAASAATPIT